MNNNFAPIQKYLKSGF